MHRLFALSWRFLLAACLVASPLVGLRSAMASDLARANPPCPHMQAGAMAAMADVSSDDMPCCPDKGDCSTRHCAPAACGALSMASVPPAALDLRVTSSMTHGLVEFAPGVTTAPAGPPTRPPIA